MPRDLDAVLDGMGWQLDEAERADMHKLQVATLLAWGVHPDSIGPTRTGRARLAQTMAEALQRAGQAGGLEPGPHWPRRVPPRDPALAGMPERFTAAGVRDRVEWRGGPCPLPLGALVTVWTRGNTGELGAPWQISRNPAGSLDWSHGDVPLASDIVAFFAETPEAVPAPAPSVALVPRGPADRDTDPVKVAASHIALTPAEIQSGMDRVRWAENLIRQLPADHEGRNSWLLNYSRPPLAPVPPSDTLAELEFFQRAEALADRTAGRFAMADTWVFDVVALRAFVNALRACESRPVGVVNVRVSKADGDAMAAELAKADGDAMAAELAKARPGHVVVDATQEHAEAVKVLQAWGYTWAGEGWAPPARASFYVKRGLRLHLLEHGSAYAGAMILEDVQQAADPTEWVAAFAGPGPWVEGPEKAFLADVLDEVLRARAKFPGDRVMGLALAEEFGELIKAVLDETPERVRREAVQTAAMCVRLVLDGDGSVKEWRAARGLAPLVQTQKGRR